MKAKLVKESINEALRYREGSWSAFARELISYEGWQEDGEQLIKYDSTDEGETIEIRVFPAHGDEIKFDVTDENGSSLSSGEFDAEGLGSGEFDGELGYYI